MMTIYYIEDLENITNYINKNRNSTANKILNISEYAYIVTALFYGVSDNNHDSQIQIIYLIVFCLLFQLPTIVFSRTQKINKSCDKTYMIQKFLKKYRFIKQFINNITMTLNTTSQQIHDDYTKHLQTYKPNL